MPRNNKGFDSFFMGKGREKGLKCRGVNTVGVGTVALTQRSVCVCVTGMKILNSFVGF